MANWMRFNFDKHVWENSTDGGSTFREFVQSIIVGTPGDFPSDPVAGDMFVGNDAMDMWLFDGTSWVALILSPFGDLAAEGGSIPEIDRVNDFADLQEFSNNTDTISHKSDSANNRRAMRWNDGGGNFVGAMEADSMDGAGASRGQIYGFDEINFGDPVTVGSPTGGAQGNGTINAEAVYDDGTLLTDYVFDAEIDGVIDTAKYDSMIPNRARLVRAEPSKDETGNEVTPPIIDTEEELQTHQPAQDFDLSELTPSNFERKWRNSRKLPALERAEQRNGTKLSVGQALQALIETCEVQAAHIADLERRIG